MVLEHHAPKQKVLGLQEGFAKVGLRTSWTPALPTRPGGKGTAGGVAWMVRKHLEAHELFNKSMLACLQCEAAPLWDICGLSLRLRGVTLSILGLYLDSSIGLAGVNIDKLNFVARLLPLLGGRCTYSLTGT